MSRFRIVLAMSWPRRHVPNGHLVDRAHARHRVGVIVFAVVDDALSPDFPLETRFVKSSDER